MDNNLKPYATTKRRKFFDWNAFLAQDKISDVEWGDAERRAGSWVTCACGNQCAIIPRNYEGEPRDFALMYAGIDFYNAVRTKDTHRAANALQQIEARAALLIRELQATPDSVADNSFTHIVG